MKRFKSKNKKTRYRIILVLMIVYIINKNFNIRFNKSKKEIIDYVFNNDISYSYRNNTIQNIYKVFNNNIFNNPVNILHDNMKIDNNSIYVSNILYVDNRPKVYIYNSHQSEMYSYSDLESSLVPNVSLAASMLKEKLEEKNIKTIVETNNIVNYMEINNMDYTESYIASRHFLNLIYEKYPDLDLYIDLHRDAITHDISTVNIDGKDCAKVLFVVGLENPNYEQNLSVTNVLNNLIVRDYPELSRGIMKKEGYGVNGVYNQDLNGNVILIEIGGNENNIYEVNNTLEIISKVIGEYIHEKEKI